jgi:hypothetical protein
VFPTLRINAFHTRPLSRIDLRDPRPTFSSDIRKGRGEAPLLAALGQRTEVKPLTDRFAPLSLAVYAGDLSLGNEPFASMTASEKPCTTPVGR